MEKPVINICLSNDEIRAMNDLLYHHVEILKSKGQEYKSIIENLEENKNIDSDEVLEVARQLFRSTVDDLECYSSLWQKFKNL